MKKILIILLTASLATSAAARVISGVRITRPEIHQSHKVQATEVPVQSVQPIEVIPTPFPIPLVTPSCEIFVDKECFSDLRKTTQ